MNALLRGRRLVRWLFIAALLTGAALLIWRIPRTLAAFALGGFIALGLYPIVEWLVQRKLPRPLAVTVAYLGLIVSVIVLIVLVVPATLAQVQNLVLNEPQYIDTVQTTIVRSREWINAHFGRILPPSRGNLEAMISQRFGDWITASASSVYEIIVGTFTAALVSLTAVVLSAFFVGSGSTIADPIYQLLPAHRRQQAREVGSEIARVFGGFVVGQVTLSLLITALVWLGTFVAGFKFSLLGALVSGIGYAVPFVGQIAAHVIVLLLALPQGSHVVIVTQLVLFIVFRVADNVLAPRIFAGRVGVSPVIVIFATFAGGELFGLPGLLFGIPAAALAKVLFDSFVLPQLRESAGDEEPELHRLGSSDPAELEGLRQH